MVIIGELNWRQYKNKLIICCNKEFKLESTKQSQTVDKYSNYLSINNIILEHIPIIKSNLQKCIRRSLIEKSIVSAITLFCLNKNELLRRLPIIMLEDTVPLSHYLMLSATLFVIGIVGVLIRRNVIVVFMSIEIILNAVNISLISFDHYMNLSSGQIFSFMVMCVAAAEVSVGLAIIIALHRNKPTVNLDEFNLLKW